MEDTGLPPRYGILTSNISESANSMFNNARDGTWLNTIDSILAYTMERISTIRSELKEEDGIVPKVLSTMRDYWDKCAGFRVLEVQDSGNQFNIVRQLTSASDTVRNYIIDVDLIDASVENGRNMVFHASMPWHTSDFTGSMR